MYLIQCILVTADDSTVLSIQHVKLAAVGR